MHQQVKKYLALFLLSLFLFPMVEKELHALEHADEVHCNATDIHFDQQEHHCNICDYTINDSFSTPKNDVLFVVYVKQIEFKNVCENIHTPSAFADLPSRAPPVA